VEFIGKFDDAEGEDGHDETQRCLGLNISSGNEVLGRGGIQR